MKLYQISIPNGLILASLSQLVLVVTYTISIPKWSDFSMAEICPISPNTPYDLAPQTLKIVDL